MSKLVKYASKAQLMNVSIGYGDEHFKFNLFLETQIKNEKLNTALEEQPTSYSFLTMLHKKLIRRAKDYKRDADSTWAKRFIFYKTSTKSPFYKDNHRNPSDDMARAYVDKDEEYTKALSELNKAEEDRDVIEACVKAFEQRKDILQTLAANTRNERN